VRVSAFSGQLSQPVGYSLLKKALRATGFPPPREGRGAQTMCLLSLHINISQTFQPTLTNLQTIRTTNDITFFTEKRDNFRR